MFPAAPTPSSASNTPRPIWAMLLVSSVVLFLVACALPALAFKRDSGLSEQTSGLSALTMGWLALKPPQVGWLANVFVVIAWIATLARAPVLARIAALLAVLAGLSSLMLFRDPAPAGSTGQMWLMDLLPGFYVWIVSLLDALIAAMLVTVRRPRADVEQTSA